MASGLRMMEIRLDDRPHGVDDGITLADLIAQLGHLPEQVGTAVNGVFVPRARRVAHVLQPGDAVLLFQPIVGG
ncbi:sulfur carrier protein ThiS [Piscinibacter sp. XHJ-5]|uniref:sulfur carrier protein ThiS n=1 Tax=Piscinibacter sp. XHJ-5 TaxID=3037797 RepID=UPI0024535799|nr:sulfur carrier protein ThiS [Piscinibacter sp. XHJ-5]